MYIFRGLCTYLSMSKAVGGEEIMKKQTRDEVGSTLYGSPTYNKIFI